MNNNRSAKIPKSKTFRMLETLGINLSPETYGDISLMKLAGSTLRLWKNEILQKITYYSVFMTPTPLAARVFVPYLHKLRGVSIAEDCFIDSCVLLDSVYPELISIGKNVSITKGCIILVHQRDLKGYTGKETLHKKGYKIAKVTIGDNVLIGSGSIILPGVKIGKGSVVGAGSVVTKDVPPGVLVAGTPAKVIKSYIQNEDE